MNKNKILISVKTPYAELLVDGIKTVELRRRFPEVAPGSTLVIYASGTRKQVIGECIVGGVHRLPIRDLWSAHGVSSMVSWEVFSSYFTGVDYGVGVVIESARRYSKPKSLDQVLNSREDSARAPQSYCYL